MCHQNKRICVYTYIMYKSEDLSVICREVLCGQICIKLGTVVVSPTISCMFGLNSKRGMHVHSSPDRHFDYNGFVKNYQNHHTHFWGQIWPKSIFFSTGLRPWPRYGSVVSSPRPSSRLKRGHPSPPTLLNAFNAFSVSISALCVKKRSQVK